MSKEVYFYKVKRISESLPEIIRVDDEDCPFSYAVRGQERDWERKYGQLRTIEYETVNIFGAAEKVFGKKPFSASFTVFSGYRFYDEHGLEIGIMSNEALRPYRYIATKEAYIYRKEFISDAGAAYILGKTEEGEKSLDDMVDILRTVINYEYVDYELLEAAAKAVIAARDTGENETVVCIIE